MRNLAVGGEHGTVKWSGMLEVDHGELQRAVKAGWLTDGVDGWDAQIVSPGKVLFAPKPNLVVNTGINMRLDRLFAINGPPTQVQRMGVDNGTTNPTATSSSSSVGGGTDTGSTTRTIIAFDSTPTRTNQVVSALGTFTQALVNFAMKRLFLSDSAQTLTNSATADTASSLHSMTNVFTIDLTAFATWSQTFTANVTGTGS